MYQVKAHVRAKLVGNLLILMKKGLAARPLFHLHRSEMVICTIQGWLVLSTRSNKSLLDYHTFFCSLMLIMLLSRYGSTLKNVLSLRGKFRWPSYRLALACGWDSSVVFNLKKTSWVAIRFPANNPVQYNSDMFWPLRPLKTGHGQGHGQVERTQLTYPYNVPMCQRKS